MVNSWAGEQLPAHKKVAMAIADIQAASWILNDLVASHDIYCQHPDTQELFDTAVKNIALAAYNLRDHLATTSQLDNELFLAAAKMVNDSYSMFKSLIFLNEIVIRDEITNLKFEQSRYRQMMGIIRLQEYVENGDDDIFTALNQRNSALVLLKKYVPQEWEKDLLKNLPNFVSQTDLYFIDEMIKRVSPGAMSRHLAAYFKVHINSAQEANFKGQLAIEILRLATGWTVEALQQLPAYVSKAQYQEVVALLKEHRRAEMPQLLADFFN